MAFFSYVCLSAVITCCRSVRDFLYSILRTFHDMRLPIRNVQSVLWSTVVIVNALQLIYHCFFLLHVDMTMLFLTCDMLSSATIIFFLPILSCLHSVISYVYTHRDDLCCYLRTLKINMQQRSTQSNDESSDQTKQQFKLTTTYSTNH